MKMIRPVSDLRNNFADISKTVHETAQPVSLTKNGYGDMVVLSMDAFENLQFEAKYISSCRRQNEAKLTDKRYSSKEVLKAMRDAIGGNRLYNLEYLPVALQDMVAIVRYISRELGNPAAADRLATELIDAGDSIPKFPYMNSSYTPINH